MLTYLHPLPTYIPACLPRCLPTPCILSCRGSLSSPGFPAQGCSFATSGSASEWLARFGSLSPRRPDLDPGAAAVAAAADGNDTGSSDDDNDDDDDTIINDNNNPSEPIRRISSAVSTPRRQPGRLID